MLERLLARDRVIVLAGVVGLAALAWLDLWRRVSGMGMEATLPHTAPWNLRFRRSARGACDGG